MRRLWAESAFRQEMLGLVAVPVVLVTHETNEAAMRAALAKIGELSAVMEPPSMIRIEPA